MTDKTECCLVESFSNMKKGYSIYCAIQFKDKYRTGYLHFWIDFINDININLIENKKYTGLLDNSSLLIDIFDTNNLLNIISGEYNIEFDVIKDDKIFCEIVINDKVEKISFKCDLNIV